MLYKVFVFLALVAMVFARPDPQAVVYSGPSVYPAAYPYYASGAYAAAPYAAFPYAYNQYYYR